MPLATSAEVLQELLHAYLPVDRMTTLDAAPQLATDLAVVWPMEAGVVTDARSLHDRYPGLAARDLLHLAVCRRHDADGLITFDRGLAAAFGDLPARLSHADGDQAGDRRPARTTMTSRRTAASVGRVPAAVSACRQ